MHERIWTISSSRSDNRKSKSKIENGWGFLQSLSRSRLWGEGRGQQPTKVPRIVS